MKKIILIDTITKQTYEPVLGAKVFKGNVELEIEYEKRMFAKSLVRKELIKKKHMYFDEQNEKYVAKDGYELQYAIDSFLREQKINVVLADTPDLP